MKANELRIGNYVDTKFDGIGVVCQLGSSINKNYVGVKSLNGGHWYNGIKPIPITAKWLMKLGFNEHENGSFWINLGGLDNPLWLEAYIKNNGCYLFLGQPPEMSDMDEQIIVLNQIKYVHELQNLISVSTNKI